MAVVLGRSLARVVLGLFALVTAAWVASTLIEDDPSHGLNLPYFGAKWVVYAYALATIVFFLAPISMFAFAATLVSPVRRRVHQNLWVVYRIGFVLVTVWMVLGLYGLWYGGAHAI